MDEGEEEEKREQEGVWKLQSEIISWTALSRCTLYFPSLCDVESLDAVPFSSAPAAAAAAVKPICVWVVAVGYVVMTTVSWSNIWPRPRRLLPPYRKASLNRRTSVTPYPLCILACTRSQRYLVIKEKNMDKTVHRYSRDDMKIIFLFSREKLLSITFDCNCARISSLFYL